MKQYKYIFFISVMVLFFASCDDKRYASQVLAENPEIEEEALLRETVEMYDVLKSYVNRTENPSFKLGVGGGLSEYVNKNQANRIANDNFDEITIDYDMKHGPMVGSDGELKLLNVEKLFEKTAEADIPVYGHTLVWHANQNAIYLNGLIAPDIIPIENAPVWTPIASADFESNDETYYEYTTNAIVSFVDGNGGGRALKLINEEVRTNAHDCQFFLKFVDKPFKLGEKYKLTMDVRADEETRYPTQAHKKPGDYLHWNLYGEIEATTEWRKFTKDVVVDESTAGTGSIAFNLGGTATSYYFDNISLQREDYYTVIEKTPAEKAELIGGAMEKWISEMVTYCKPYVPAWDVVNEPMDDDDPYRLKTGAGKDLLGDEFYWQDYLGEDYAVQAFKLAEKYGNPTDKLFINDYNLEYSLDKCKGLIQYVEYIESKGARVDGIGTQMHINLETNKENIAEMFRLLAATKKLIKVSELDVAMGKEPLTASRMAEQAEMYKYVVDMYFKYIPAEQRYGITIWGLRDSPKGSSWLEEQQQTLWNVDYRRKYAYKGVCDGLAGKDVSKEF